MSSTDPSSSKPQTKTKIAEESQPSALKIFVGCIPGKATESSILEVFAAFPGQKHLHLERRKNNKCSGFGHLEVSSELAYQQILASTHYLGERKLTVLPFLEKKELMKSQLKFNKRRLIVAQLPHDTTDEDLEQHFSPYGALEKAFVVKNNKDKSLLPYGHIIFRSAEDAKRAKNSQHFFQGKLVSITTHKIDVKKKLKEIKKSEKKNQSSKKSAKRQKNSTTNQKA